MKPSKGVEKRGKQTRKRNPIVLYAAEGDNKTESTYLQNFQKRIYAKPSLEMLRAAMDGCNPELNTEDPLWPDDEEEFARLCGLR